MLARAARHRRPSVARALSHAPAHPVHAILRAQRVHLRAECRYVPGNTPRLASPRALPLAPPSTVGGPLRRWEAVTAATQLPSRLLPSRALHPRHPRHPSAAQSPLTPHHSLPACCSRAVLLLLLLLLPLQATPSLCLRRPFSRMPILPALPFAFFPAASSPLPHTTRFL